MVINIDKTHRIRRHGARNWSLEERHGKGWRGTGYFQTLAAAVARCYERACIADGYAGDLGGALDRAQAIADGLAAKVEEACRGQRA